MKKILISMFFLVLAPLALAQETDCPYGFVNESAPGTCGLYRDTDGNFICDLSQLPESAPIAPSAESGVHSENELKSMSVGEMARLYDVSPNAFAAALADFLGSNVDTSDNMGDLHDSVGLCTGVASQIAGNLEAGYATTLKTDNKTVINTKSPYAFVPVALGVIILYGITYVLALQKKITIITHRKIWNIILTVTFLASGILGLLLVLRINYGWFADWHLFMLKWHVEFGVAMTIICFFHIAWHWPYYRNLIKKST